MAADELVKLQAEATQLQALLDDPATSVASRTYAQERLSAVRSRIEQLETSLHPTPRAGEAPTAGA